MGVEANVRFLQYKEVFDVPLLVSLISYSCPLIENPGTQLWKHKLSDPNSPEYLLKIIKDTRNIVMHEPDKQLIDQLEKNRILVYQFLNIFGEIAGVSQDEIEMAIQEIDDMIQEVIKKTTSSSEVM